MCAFLQGRKLSPMFFRPKFFHGRPRGLSATKCLFFSRICRGNKLNFSWSKTAGTPFLTPKSPEKLYVGPFFASFPRKHINCFLGVQNGVFWVGAKKCMLKNCMCFFGPLKILEGLTKVFYRMSAGMSGPKLRDAVFLLTLGSFLLTILRIEL